MLKVLVERAFQVEGEEGWSAPEFSYAIRDDGDVVWGADDGCATAGVGMTRKEAWRLALTLIWDLLATSLKAR
jgi:hypothetical protein